MALRFPNFSICDMCAPVLPGCVCTCACEMQGLSGVAQKHRAKARKSLEGIVSHRYACLLSDTNGQFSVSQCMHACVQCYGTSFLILRITNSKCSYNMLLTFILHVPVDGVLFVFGFFSCRFPKEKLMNLDSEMVCVHSCCRQFVQITHYLFVAFIAILSFFFKLLIWMLLCFFSQPLCYAVVVWGHRVCMQSWHCERYFSIVKVATRYLWYPVASEGWLPVHLCCLLPDPSFFFIFFSYNHASVWLCAVQDAANLLRGVSDKKVQHVTFRDQRPSLLAEEVKFVPSGDASVRNLLNHVIWACDRVAGHWYRTL